MNGSFFIALLCGSPLPAAYFASLMAAESTRTRASVGASGSLMKQLPENSTTPRLSPVPGPWAILWASLLLI